MWRLAIASLKSNKNDTIHLERARWPFSHLGESLTQMPHLIHRNTNTSIYLKLSSDKFDLLSSFFTYFILENTHSQILLQGLRGIFKKKFIYYESFITDLLWTSWRLYKEVVSNPIRNPMTSICSLSVQQKKTNYPESIRKRDNFT